MTHAAAVAVFLMVGMTSASAQRSPTACSFDTTARLRPDTVILGLAAGKRDVSREVLADYLSAADAIREQFSRPTMLRLPFAARAVTRKQQPRSSYAPFGLYGLVRFQLDSTGRLTTGAVMVSSASSDIADAIVAAVHRADSAYAFPPPSKALRRENSDIVLRFVDTVQTKEPSVALVRLIIPAIPLDDDPVVHFPPEQHDVAPAMGGARFTTSRTRVLFEFIIGVDSVIEPGSLQILDSPSSTLTARAMEGLKIARFRPAKINGCAVPALVRLPLDMVDRASITVPVQRGP